MHRPVDAETLRQDAPPRDAVKRRSLQQEFRVGAEVVIKGRRFDIRKVTKKDVVLRRIRAGG